MQIDRNAINRLTSLDDDRLKAVLNRLAHNSGIDLSHFNISAEDMASIRRILNMATDEDLKKITEKFNSMGRQRK